MGIVLIFIVGGFFIYVLDSWLILNFRIIEIEMRKFLFVFYNYLKYFIGNFFKVLKYIFY